jgi:DNA-binding protein Fis
VEHAALVARGGPIFAEHLPPPIEFIGVNDASTDTTINLQHCVRQWFDANNTSIQKGMLYEEFLPVVEAPLFSAVLEQTNKNQAAAAEWLGIHRATLRKRLGRIHDQD